jgi:NAD-dependent deacetylase
MVRLSEQLHLLLKTAESVVAFTGAGISAESGVPTFRGGDGIWAKMRPEELASMAGFLKNPDLVWQWYAHRKKVIAEVEPNAGHRALVSMERLFPRVTVITQNIDNLHRRAGSSVVHELHGNIERNYCMKCGTAYANEAVLAAPGVPLCNACGGTIRPDVVWFGEMLPEDEWERALRAAHSADLFFSIGTSSVVYPAASLPLTAKMQGAYLVEINPERTPLTGQADEFLQGMAGDILPAVYTCAEQERRAKI